ncbi:hypothetical protein ACEPPN_019479 [Leptodophora sp. 'Broadleaf-Isolate-01']
MCDAQIAKLSSLTTSMKLFDYEIHISVFHGPFWPFYVLTTESLGYGNALQAAINEGQEAVVKLLLHSGADVNAQGGHYGNVLQVALWKGSEAVV